jgi:uncharacterized membrane protein YgcG
MKFVKRLLTVVIISLFWPLMVYAQNRPVGNWVVDNANLLQPAQLEQVKAASQAAERDLGARLGVLLTSGTPDPKALAVQTINDWQMGPKSALILVSLNPRKVYIQPGNAYASALDASTCTNIVQNTIAPRFKAGDWTGGLLAGLDAVRGRVTMVVAPAPQAPHQNGTVTKTTTTRTTTQPVVGVRTTNGPDGLTVFLVIVGVIVGLILLIAFLSWVFDRPTVYTSTYIPPTSPASYTPGSVPPVAPVSTYRSPPVAYSSGPVYPAPVAYSPPPVVIRDNSGDFLTGMVMGEMLESNRHHDHGYGYSAPAPPPVSYETTTTETTSYSDSSSSSSYDSGSSFSSDFGSSGISCDGGGGGGGDF